MQTLSAFIVLFALSLPARAQSGGMSNTLMLMSIASLGSVLTSTCRTVSGAALPPSVIEFSNASAAYILAEINEANTHKNNIDLRNAAVDALAERVKRDGGGDVQKKSFEEALTERQYLLAFMNQRRMWIETLIMGYDVSASLAAGEDNTGDNQIVCTGTLEAALPLGDALGMAFDPVIGSGGSGDTVATYLNSVLGIVAGEILPLIANPEGRVRVAEIGSETAGLVKTELTDLTTAISGNISDIQIVLRGFESDAGVPEGSGVTAPRAPEKGTQGENRDAGTRQQVPENGNSGSTNLASASAVSASGTSAANFRPRSCAERAPDGKSFTLKEICPNPAKFLPVIVKGTNLTLKSAADATTAIANSLAKGEVAEAQISATTLNSMSAKISSAKAVAVKNANATRVQTGKPMINLSEDTKKAISRMTGEIQTQVTKMGGAKLLASTTAPIVTTKLVAPTVESPAQDLRNIPARLRGKYLQEMRGNTAVANPGSMASPGVSQVAAPVAENDPTLWERLTNRYRSNYGRFFERKAGPEESSPSKPGTP